ncbi:hypothetical protein [Agrobacterium tumefaciens]|uniref:HEPN domain-containing protein n=1 Tax=Agrobacterium tumefaciens TaxID=358 RepID=A0AB36EQ52_AGRTU|nr:hypothetical protein A6U91_06210 [Agrobacterium tumefaciens]
MPPVSDEEIAELFYEAVRLAVIAERTADERDWDMPDYSPKQSAIDHAKQGFLELVSALRRVD